MTRPLPAVLRWVLTAIATFALACTALGVGAGPAAAHSRVVSSDPADGAQLDTGPARVSFTFNENLQPSFPSLTVVGPDGNVWSKGDATVTGATVAVPVGQLGPAGTYTMAYRVTSADGHPVSGTRSFVLTKPGTGTPGPKASEAGHPATSTGSHGAPLWIFVVAAVVVFGAALAFALTRGRKNPQ